jgi:hypothetical protein
MTRTLRPATRTRSPRPLSFAFRYDGRKRVHHADDMMARITAERPVQDLEASGFVLMKRPPRGGAVSGGEAIGRGHPFGWLPSEV